MIKIFFALYLIIFLDRAYTQDIPPKREFRSAWVATVANIDYPSSQNASSGEQIIELVSIMDKLKEAGINAVIFQVRTECDALYKSSFEPWSYWLTGKQGKNPEPFFDPLAFAVDEAHKRGMELHAWFNPYRAVKNENDYINDVSHITITHPEWVLDFGKYKMLNPGIPEVKDYIANIVSDVVRRYDIDGVHFDDYFYPYTPKITNEDSLTFLIHKKNFTNIDNWRRNNINSMVAQVYDSINAINPRIKFGISPFGIVENKYAGTSGFESYSILYCDPLTWIEDRTVDYITPQLYWETDHKAADYTKLLPWWASITEDVHLYIGLFSSKMMSTDYKGSFSEIGNQIRMNRETENVLGSVFFSAKSIFNNYTGFIDTLKNLYKYPALLPSMPWKDDIPPLSPSNVLVEEDSIGRNLKWTAPLPAADGNTASYYVIYKFPSEDEINLEDPRFILHITANDINFYRDSSIINENEELFYIVTALDKLHNESKPGNSIGYFE